MDAIGNAVRVPQLTVSFNQSVWVSHQADNSQNVIQDFQSEARLDKQDATVRNCAIVYWKFKDVRCIMKASANNSILVAYRIPWQRNVPVFAESNMSHSLTLENLRRQAASYDRWDTTLAPNRLIAIMHSSCFTLRTPGWSSGIMTHLWQLCVVTNHKQLEATGVLSFLGLLFSLFLA